MYGETWKRISDIIDVATNVNWTDKQDEEMAIFFGDFNSYYETKKRQEKKRKINAGLKAIGLAVVVVGEATHILRRKKR
jgi:hypothetical protein